MLTEMPECDYQSFYGLTKSPFSLLPDPVFLYLGERHGKALSTLRYSLTGQAGFTVLTGEAGCGKTSLVAYLLNECSESFRVGMLSNLYPDMSRLLPWVLEAFGIDTVDLSEAKCHQLFSEFVTEQYREGRRVLLIVDEAQNLSPQLLEELRMLTNINVYTYFFQVFLAGQPELVTTLRQPQLHHLVQRITGFQHLTPFDLGDTGRYIDHRIACAGGKAGLFTSKAVRSIHHLSQGVPRRVNFFCDLALARGQKKQRPTIDADLVAEVVREQVETGLGNGQWLDETESQAEIGHSVPLPAEGQARAELRRTKREPLLVRSVDLHHEQGTSLVRVGGGSPERKPAKVNHALFPERERTLEEARKLLARWLD